MRFLPDQKPPRTWETSKSSQKWLASPGGCSSPPGSSSRNLEIGENDKCRLAVGSLPPGGSSSGT